MVEPVSLIEGQVVIGVDVSVIVVIGVPDVNPTVPVEVCRDHEQVGEGEIPPHLAALVADVVVSTVVDPQSAISILAPASDGPVLDDCACVVVPRGDGGGLRRWQEDALESRTHLLSCIDVVVGPDSQLPVVVVAPTCYAEVVQERARVTVTHADGSGSPPTPEVYVGQVVPHLSRCVSRVSTVCPYACSAVSVGPPAANAAVV